MSEQTPEQDEPRGARDVIGEAMADALAREVVGLLAFGLILAVLDPRVRMWAAGLVRRVRWQLRDSAQAAQEHAVARLRKDISDYEHQAAAAAKPADGGCGCV